MASVTCDLTCHNEGSFISLMNKNRSGDEQESVKSIKSCASNKINKDIYYDQMQQPNKHVNKQTINKTENYNR